MDDWKTTSFWKGNFSGAVLNCGGGHCKASDFFSGHLYLYKNMQPTLAYIVHGVFATCL